MKNNTPHQESHPADEYFREQEANIPVTFDETHWAALKSMLEQSNVPQKGGGHAPGTSPAGAGATGQVVKTAAIAVLLFALASTAWLAVEYSATSATQRQEAPASIPTFESNENSRSVPPSQQSLSNTEEAEEMNTMIAQPGNGASTRLQATPSETTAQETTTEIPQPSASQQAPTLSERPAADSLITTSMAPQDTLPTVVPKKKKYLIW